MPRFVVPALAASVLAFAVLTAPAAAAAPPPTVCSPSTCGDQGQSRSIVLKPKAIKRKASGKARTAKVTSKRTSLRVAVSSAPKQSRPRVTITGPHHFKRVISKSRTFRGVRPGRYFIDAKPIAGGKVTSFPTYKRTRAQLRKGAAGWVGVRFRQQVASTTRVAQPSAIQAVTGSPGGVRDITVDDPKHAIVPGSVLAVGVGPNTPTGLLIHVDSVTHAGDQTIARGGPAALTEIGPQADVIAEPRLTMSKQQFAAALAGGPAGAFKSPLRRTLLSTAPSGFDRSFVCSTPLAASLKGDVTFDAGTDIDISWGGFWHPLTIKAHAGVNLKQTANLTVTLSGEAKCKLDMDLLSRDYEFSPWEFFVGPVPVVIVPKLNFHLSGDATAGAKLSTTVKESLDTSFGLDWDGDRLKPYGNADATFDTTPLNPSGSLDVKASIGPKLIFDIYDIAGPYLTADLFVRLKADTAKDPWWRLTSGLQAGGGLRFKVWKFEFDRNIPDIWSKSWTIAEAKTPPVPEFTTDSLPNADYGKPYSATVKVASKRGPVTLALADGPLPEGLKFDADTGKISGTATGYGSTPFVLSAKDKAGTARQTYTILTTTQPAVVATAALPGAMVGSPYSVALAATGSHAPFAWSVTGGELPPGMELTRGGVLQGTPAIDGPRTFTVHVEGADQHRAERTLSIGVEPAPLVVTSHVLSDGKADVAYSQPLTASGGHRPYTWSVDPATIPAGLSVGADGIVSGTPAGPSTSPISVTVRDPDGRVTSGSVALAIADVDPVKVTTATLPQGMAGVAYHQALAAMGGRAPYTWAADPSTVPGGLTLGADGVLDGHPTTAGTAQVAVTATDREGRHASRTLTLEILAPGMEIGTRSLPEGYTTYVYDEPLVVVGGTGPYMWSVDTGALPAGLSLDPATGDITGTPDPAAIGTATFTARVQDANGTIDTQDLTLTVADGAGVFVDDASCPSADFCMALDRNDKVYTRTASAEWSAGLYAGVPTTPSSASSVSCASETFCMVITGDGQTAIYDGGGFHRGPTIDDADSEISDLSCVTDTYCVAGGRHVDKSVSPFVYKAAVWVWDGSAWTVSLDDGPDNLDRVACSAVDNCVAVGNPATYVFDGTDLTQLADLSHPGFDLACASATQCFAGSSSGGTSVWDGTTWTETTIGSGSDTLWFSPVGCARIGTTCAAGGKDTTGAVNGHLWTWDGTDWTEGPLMPSGSWATAASCASPTYCVALTNKGASFVWNGTAWSGPRPFAHA